MEEGTPDLDICIGGVCVKIEVKQPGEQPEPIQALRLRQWKEAGAVTGCCHSVDEAMELTDGVFRFLMEADKWVMEKEKREKE